MTAFSGIVAKSPLYPSSGGLEGGVLDSRTFSVRPSTTTMLGAKGLGGGRTLHQPISIPSRSATGGLAPMFGLSDWYNRIHITPSLIALGNLVSGLTKTVRVWNAWLDFSRTVTDVTGVGIDGITLTLPSALPITFTPNLEQPWLASISTEGPPTISAVFTLSFTDGETPSLAITGQRISAWALTPDWAQPVNERFEFKTDILRAWTGAEQRRALRMSPRRTFSFDVQLKDREKRYVEAQLYAWSSQIWALPIWPDGQLLASASSPGDTSITCDTVNRDFVAGGLAIIIADASNYEVLQVQSVSSTSIGLVNTVQNYWPSGSKLFPVRSARLSSFPKITRANGAFATATPEFLVIDASDWPAATGLPTYRGFPVVENSPDESDGLEMTYQREAVTIDAETGVIEVDDRGPIGFSTNTHSWFIRGKTSRAAFRSLLYLLKGRQGEIWVPTYQSDLKLAAPISVSAGSIDVEMTGYTLYLLAQRGRQDIRVELSSGTVIYKRITGASILDANTERLAVDSAFSSAITLAQVRRISYMALCRLDSDAIELQHHTSDHGLATAVTPWRSVSDVV